MPRYLVYTQFMPMAGLHSDIRRHLPVEQTNRTAWYGPFDSFAEATEFMDSLGIRNIGPCRQCKPTL